MTAKPEETLFSSQVHSTGLCHLSAFVYNMTANLFTSGKNWMSSQRFGSLVCG
jgi:hypothetical protein